MHINWARRTSWGWWDDWDDTVLQTQDSKFEPWRSEVEHATSRSRRLPTILTFTRGWGRNIFVSFKPPRPGTEPRTLAWKAAVLTTTLEPPPYRYRYRYSRHKTLNECWLTLDQRRRRWTSFKPTLIQRLVFLGMVYITLFSAGIDFRRQNLTSVDVRFWRLKSITALKE